MATIRTSSLLGAAVAAALLLAPFPGPAQAHCDSMDGPVIADARRAIASAEVGPVLKWIPEKDEQAVKEALEMTLEVRGESDAARELADRWFFETLVRLHRESEGEGFTGIKPAGSVEPGIAAADEALETGEIDGLADELAAAIRAAVIDRFEVAHEARRSAEESPEQGRRYVEAYVQFTHFVEHVDHLLEEGASHQHRETQAAHAH